MRNVLLVFLGGGIGSAARFVLSTAIQRASGLAFPWGTLTVNCAGCCLIGALWALSARTALPLTVSVFLFAGILGGFTTFSSFSIETFHLLHNNAWRSALAYVLMTNVLGVSFTVLGFILAQAVMK